MTKTLFYTAFLSAFLLAGPVAAQTLTPEDVAQMAADAGVDVGLGDGSMPATPDSAPSGSVYLRGGAPINLRPNAYISRQPDNSGVQVDPSQMVQRDTMAYPKPTMPNSVSAYNAGLLQSRAARTQPQYNSPIPSPFPEGW